MRNKHRLKKLEEHFIGDDLTVYIPCILDSSIPKGFYQKIVHSNKTTTKEILSQKEYEEEIKGCTDLIRI